eukprot:4099070-Karenia_brevis.AAC.1
MAYQPHTPSCRKRFEEVLEGEAKVRNQKSRMEEFEEREKLRGEKKEERKGDEDRGDRSQERRKKTGGLMEE